MSVTRSTLAPGRLLTVEGGEGVGKSTQVKLLVERLRATGLEVVATREPGGTIAAERVRSLLLDPTLDWSPDAEILLHFAARAEHLDRIVLPALARGAIVVSDRFFDSTMAYQHHGAGADRTLIDVLVGQLPVKPALTLVLFAPAAQRAERMAARRGAADRYENKSEAFHERVAQGFRAICAAEPERCRAIDASGDIDTVAGSIWRIVAPLAAAVGGGGVVG